MGLAAFIGGCGQRSRTSGEATDDIALVDSAPIRSPEPRIPVHTIALPHDEPVFPPGPGREEFVTACVVCHSPRYITMQPRFSRTTWLSEVKKMKDVYGEHISEVQVQKITERIVSIQGQLDTGKAPEGT